LFGSQVLTHTRKMSAGPEIKLFTLEEVKVHNGKDDPKVWFVYKDSVYDVTNYLDDVSKGLI